MAGRLSSFRRRATKDARQPTAARPASTLLSRSKRMDAWRPMRRRRVFKHLDAFLTIENVFDQRYRNINIRAFTNPEELVGAPQNPRRVTVGFEMKVK